MSFSQEWRRGDFNLAAFIWEDNPQLAFIKYSLGRRELTHVVTETKFQKRDSPDNGTTCLVPLQFLIFAGCASLFQKRKIKYNFLSLWPFGSPLKAFKVGLEILWAGRHTKVGNESWEVPGLGVWGRGQCLALVLWKTLPFTLWVPGLRI